MLREDGEIQTTRSRWHRTATSPIDFVGSLCDSTEVPYPCMPLTESAIGHYGASELRATHLPRSWTREQAGRPRIVSSPASGLSRSSCDTTIMTASSSHDSAQPSSLVIRGYSSRYARDSTMGSEDPWSDHMCMDIDVSDRDKLSLRFGAKTCAMTGTRACVAKVTWTCALEAFTGARDQLHVGRERRWRLCKWEPCGQTMGKPYGFCAFRRAKRSAIATGQCYGVSYPDSILVIVNGVAREVVAYRTMIRLGRVTSFVSPQNGDG